MGHSPYRYSVTVADAAALAAYPSTFDSGDRAYVASLGYSFTFNSASAAAVDNVNVINGPGGVGRWLIAPDGALSVSPGAVTLLGDRLLDLTVPHLSASQPVQITSPDAPGVFGLSMQAAAFGPQIDQTFHSGYFANGVSGEPNLWFSCEHNYLLGGIHTSEMHVQCEVNSVFTRPLSAQINRTTGRVSSGGEWAATGHDPTDPIPDAYWQITEHVSGSINVRFQMTGPESDTIVLGANAATQGAIRLADQGRIVGRYSGVDYNMMRLNAGHVDIGLGALGTDIDSTNGPIRAYNASGFPFQVFSSGITGINQIQSAGSAPFSYRYQGYGAPAAGGTTALNPSLPQIWVNGTLNAGAVWVLDFGGVSDGLFELDFGDLVAASGTATLRLTNGSASVDYTIGTTPVTKGGLLTLRARTNRIVTSA